MVDGRQMRYAVAAYKQLGGTGSLGMQCSVTVIVYIINKTAHM